MSYLSTRTYVTMGTQEYVLAQAGLVEVDQDFTLATPSERLSSLFSSPPNLGEIKPALVQLVVAEAHDRSGILDGGTVRFDAFEELVKQGLSHAKRGHLYGYISKAADLVWKEMEVSRNGYR